MIKVQSSISMSDSQCELYLNVNCIVASRDREATEWVTGESIRKEKWSEWRCGAAVYAYRGSSGWRTRAPSRGTRAVSWAAGRSRGTRYSPRGSSGPRAPAATAPRTRGTGARTSPPADCHNRVSFHLMITQYKHKSMVLCSVLSQISAHTLNK